MMADLAAYRSNRLAHLQLMREGSTTDSSPSLQGVQQIARDEDRGEATGKWRTAGQRTHVWAVWDVRGTTRNRKFNSPEESQVM